MNASLLRSRLDTIVFGTDTPAGKAFDVVLIYTILVSVAAVMLDSVQPLHDAYGPWFFYLEWFFTLLFTVEYLMRIFISSRPFSYIFSFYGLIDFLSIAPSYLALFFPGSQYLLIVRLFRVLRIFRVFKLVRYTKEANLLIDTIAASRRKITVFLFAVLVVCTVFGSLMFLVEGPQQGFTSIPKSIYWTVVTVTTVGYGDITPHTVLGQIISTMAMLTGYAIIAVPTGIFSVSLMEQMKEQRKLIECSGCGRGGHSEDAQYCKHCGTGL